MPLAHRTTSHQLNVVMVHAQLAPRHFFHQRKPTIKQAGYVFVLACLKTKVQRDIPQLFIRFLGVAFAERFDAGKKNEFHSKVLASNSVVSKQAGKYCAARLLIVANFCFRETLDFAKRSSRQYPVRLTTSHQCRTKERGSPLIYK